MPEIYGPLDGPTSAASVTVSPDPTLMAADPEMMACAGRAFSAAAHQIYGVFQSTSTATAVLLGAWHGQGASGFSDAAEQNNANAQTAAEAMIGAGNALLNLSHAIREAKSQASQGVSLAASVNRSAAALNGAIADDRAQAVAALPRGAPDGLIEAAYQPSAAQQSQIGQLGADAARAEGLVAAANRAAQAAWLQAQIAFDAVTAQSPTVQLDLISARGQAFGKEMDSLATLALGVAIAGAMTGGDGGDGDDEDDGDDDVVDDPGALDAELARSEDDAGAGTNVDGVDLDHDTVVVGNSDLVVKIADEEQAALGDPGGGTTIADPSEWLSSTGEHGVPYLAPPGDSSAGAQPGPAEPADPQVPATPEGWPELPADAQGTFTGKVEPYTMLPGVTYYRLVGEGNAPDGSFWTDVPPTASDRELYAIRGDWNSMTGVVEATPANDDYIHGWQGAAAPQDAPMPDGSPGHLSGGGQQIWIPKGAVNNNSVSSITIQPIEPGDGG